MYTDLQPENGYVWEYGLREYYGKESVTSG